MLCQLFLTLELELSTSLSKLKIVKKYNCMGVRAVPQHYFKSFCIYIINKKHLGKLPSPIPQLILVFLLIQS